MVPSKLNEKSDSVMILKNSPLPPSFTFTSMQDLQEEEILIKKLEKYLGEDLESWPPVIKNLLLSEKKDHLATIAFGLSVIYLE